MAQSGCSTLILVLIILGPGLGEGTLDWGEKSQHIPLLYETLAPILFCMFMHTTDD